MRKQQIAFLYVKSQIPVADSSPFLWPFPSPPTPISWLYVGPLFCEQGSCFACCRAPTNQKSEAVQLLRLPGRAWHCTKPTGDSCILDSSLVSCTFSTKTTFCPKIQRGAGLCYSKTMVFPYAQPWNLYSAARPGVLPPPLSSPHHSCGDQ